MAREDSSWAARVRMLVARKRAPTPKPAAVRDWSSMREMCERLLQERTGKPLAYWNKRVKKDGPKTQAALHAWLKKEGVTGYAAQLLVWESHLSYPDFLTATADELIDAQYAGKPAMRRVYDAVVDAALACGDVAVQARKTYVALVTGRRTFARVQAKKDRVDVGLRLERAPRGRLKPSRIHASMPVQLELASVGDVDAEARKLLAAAYDANA